MPADLTSFKAREVTRALQLIHRIWFEEMGREYWIRHGTLLGAFRHQGFIPGDNDGDVTLLGGELDTRETIRLMDARLFEMDRRFVIREDNPRHAQVISLRRWLPVAGRGTRAFGRYAACFQPLKPKMRPGPNLHSLQKGSRRYDDQTVQE